MRQREEEGGCKKKKMHADTNNAFANVPGEEGASGSAEEGASALGELEAQLRHVGGLLQIRDAEVARLQLRLVDLSEMSSSLRPERSWHGGTGGLRS